jgi:hypothetical protein
MFERYTERARRVLFFARETASEANQVKATILMAQIFSALDALEPPPPPQPRHRRADAADAMCRERPSRLLL